MSFGAFPALTRISASGEIPGWTAGLYYGNDTQNAVASFIAAVLTPATIYALWCSSPPEGVDLDRIGAEITTPSSGKNFRCAVYLPDGARRRPNTLLVDSGNLSATSNAFVQATIAVRAPGNGFWLCINAEDGTMQFRSLVAAARIPLVGKSAGGGSPQIGCLTVAQTFGAFPAAFPAGAVPTASSPIINVRAA